MATSQTIWIVLRTCATLIPGGSSVPNKPYYNISEVFPYGMPCDMPEDSANYCYTVISVPRVGDQTEEFWNVKIEESGCANESLIVEGWGYDKAGAGELLDKCVMEHVGPIERPNNVNINKRSLFDPNMVTYHSEYMVSKEHSKGPEDVWFWWDIVEVKLEPVKMYDIINAEYEKARVENMKERKRGRWRWRGGAGAS
jgi:hypothetical protein